MLFEADHLEGSKELDALARGNLSEKKKKKPRVLIHLPFLLSAGLLQGLLIGQTQLEAEGKRNKVSLPRQRGI